MDVEIGEVVTTVKAIDGSALLTPDVLQPIDAELPGANGHAPPSATGAADGAGPVQQAPPQVTR